MVTQDFKNTDDRYTKISIGTDTDGTLMLTDDKLHEDLVLFLAYANHYGHTTGVFSNNASDNETRAQILKVLHLPKLLKKHGFPEKHISETIETLLPNGEEVIKKQLRKETPGFENGADIAFEDEHTAYWAGENTLHLHPTREKTQAFLKMVLKDPAQIADGNHILQLAEIAALKAPEQKNTNDLPKIANQEWEPVTRGLPEKIPTTNRQELIEQGMPTENIDLYWQTLRESMRPGSKIPKPDFDEWSKEQKTAQIITLPPHNKDPSGMD